MPVSSGSSPTPHRRGLSKVVSGGQTGVDRAALDAAIAVGLPVGGWCPRSRLAEDGRIPDHYPLNETPEPVYAQRTEWNVRDSDGTLAVCRGKPTGGTALTLSLALEWRRSVFLADLDAISSAGVAKEWLDHWGVSVLNVAGPRRSQSPGIYEDAFEFLLRLFSEAVSKNA